jgi:iron complex outermembrane receptor protein
MIRRHCLCGITAIIILAAVSDTALAQSASAQLRAAPAAGSSPELEEVVVTAEKRTENLQKAPASIVAVSGEALQNAGITDPQQLDKLLPSANLRQEGPVVQVFIRGVGGRVDTPNLFAASTFVYNGIPVPRAQPFGVLFDLDSVQAISGPQGTLYGGTAAGGAVNIITAQPQNNFSGSALLEGGNRGEGHVAVNQNMPLGRDVSLRAAVDYNRHDGYFNNGIQAGNKPEGRLSLLATPTDNLTVLLFASAAKETGTPFTSGLLNPSPANPWDLPPEVGGVPINVGATYTNDQAQIVGANVEWRVGGNVFTYIPGLAHTNVDYKYYYILQPPTLLRVTFKEDQLTQELRWSRQVGALQLSAGAFYLHDPLTFGEIVGKGFTINNTSQTNTTYAGFGQAVYSVTDRLRITAGGRASTDKVEATGVGVGGRPNSAFAFDHSQHTPDGKLGLDYDFTPRILIYANVQTSYIEFGYNPVPTAPGRNNLVPESKLLAYSAGFKSRFFDNRLEINNEAFYYNYKDFQAVQFVTATALSSVLNAKRSTIYGDEIDVKALLPLDTEFDAGLTLQSAHYNEFSGVGYNYSGNQMAMAPTANLFAGLQHRVSLGESGGLLGRVQTHYESGHYGLYYNLPADRQSAYTRTDLTLTYLPNRGDWHLEAYVHNVENATVFGTISLGNTPTSPGTVNLEPPRTYGVGLFFRWL